MGIHTVEKIGGTSMTRFGELMENILIGNRRGPELYNRIFVVSAYGGVTNLLLENKKTAEPGIFAAFAAGDRSWADKLESTRAELIRLNRTFESLGLRQDAADDFVNERMDGVKSCLRNLMQLLEECPVTCYALRKEDSSEWCEVSDQEMIEFRALCDPNFSDTHIMSQDDAEAKPGKMVRVVHGPFTGMTGKLHRVKNKFYFIKTLAGFGVMIRISRWYCEVMKEDSKKISI